MKLSCTLNWDDWVKRGYFQLLCWSSSLRLDFDLDWSKKNWSGIIEGLNTRFEMYIHFLGGILTNRIISDDPGLDDGEG